jgi:hypothetical protein
MSSAPAIGREQLLIGICTQELLTAANVGYEAAVRGLLDAGADPNAAGGNGDRALLLGCDM